MVGSVLALLLVALVVLFAKRDAVLNALVKRAINKAKREYALDVRIKNARFSGLSTVLIDELSAVPEHRDSIARLNGLRVGVKLLPLLFGEVKLAEFKLLSGKINLVKRDSTANYDFLFRKKTSSTTSRRASLADIANNLLQKLLNKIPDDMSIRNFDVQFNDNGDRLDLYTTAATIDNGKLVSTVRVNGNESTWHFDGNVNPGDRQFDVHLYADGKKVELPILERKFQLKLNFDTLNMRLNEVDKSGSELHLSGVFGLKNLLLHHPKIAGNDIVVPAGSLDANLTIGENFIAVDSSSVIHLKEISANPYLKYTLSPHKIYELKLHTGELDAQQLFASFPQGLFESLEGIKVAGHLQYDLNFYLDASLPDSVQFSSSLDKRDFRIASWGKINLQKINNPFIYTPFEEGKPMRDILIGPDNPSFVPLESISPNLKNAVLTAEDPTFFSHHGFVELAFRRSIATNFKKKAFKQGGSTISMQLVKNVYLNRQKTIARKIEELLMVWLIENNRLSTKTQMFETYLNLIEWGRNVYGIGEASQYYFDKSPSDLSLGESIFLASIVPRPKKALYFFEPDGRIRESLRGYFRLIGGLMARRGYAAPDSNAYEFDSVRLKESLRTLTFPGDSTLNDSTLFMQDEEDTQSFLDRVLKKEPEKKPDTINIRDLDKLKAIPKDTVKTNAEKRKERREARKKEREEKKKAKDPN